MGAKTNRNRDERKKARRKLLKGLATDSHGGRKTYKKHGEEIKHKWIQA